MATTTDNRPEEDRIQRHYDDEFEALTSAEHQAKDGTSGDIGGAERGFYRDEAGGEGEDAGDATDTKESDEKASGRDDKSTAKSDSANETKERGLFTDEDGKAKTKRGGFLPSRLRSRRSIAGILITAIIGGGGFFGLGSISQIAQPIQLAHILSHAQDKASSDSSDRNAHLLRWARAAQAGDIGLTRVNEVGRRIYGPTIKQLADMGIEFEKGTAGFKTRTKFDTEKMAKAHPDLKGLNDDQLKSKIVDIMNDNARGKLNITVDQLKGTNGKFSLDVSKMTASESRALTKSNISLLNDGKIIGGIKFRTLARVFGEPSIFHPFKRAEAAIGKKFINGKLVSDSEQAKQAEEEAQRKLATKVSGDAGISARERAAGKLGSFTSKVTKAATAQGFVCIIKDLGDEVIEIDRKRITLPAEAAATRQIAIGSQMMTGQDFDPSQPRGNIATFTDKAGNTIWQSKALKALAGQDTKGAIDIDDTVKSGFGSQKVALAISKLADDVLSPIGGAGIACNEFVLITEGVVIIGAAGLAEYLSGGLATPFLAALFVGNQAKNAAISFVGIKLLTTFVLDKATVDALAKDAFEGVSGGSLYAYGARAAGNEAAIATGGVALGNESSTKFAAESAERDKLEFQSKSLFARIFDYKDYRSLSGKLVQMISPSTTQNVANAASSFKHVGSSFGNLLTAFTPKAAAAGSNYNWGFPQYGLPDDMLDDAALSDPYANAEDTVGPLLNEQCRDGDTVTDCDLRSRAMKCFGADINLETDPDSGGLVWGVINAQVEDGIDPNSAEYSEAHCGDVKNDANWRSIVMFINDTSTMNGVACYEGDELACEDLGMTTVASSATGAPTDFRIGSFNICYGIATDGGLAVCAKGVDYKTRLAKTVSYIKGDQNPDKDLGMDVVGLQEVRGPDTPAGDQYTALKKALPNFDIFPKPYGKSYPGQNPVMWNKDRFRLVQGKAIAGYTVTGGPLASANTQVKLEDIISGQQFYLINEHEPVGTGDGGPVQAEIWRKESAEKRAEYVKQLAGEGLPIFITGDMNSSYEPNAGNHSAYQNKWENLPYCILTKDGGLKDAIDASDGKESQCPSINGGNGVDHIYMSSSVVADGYYYGGGGVASNGSDHNTLSVHVSIAGTGEAAQSSVSYKNPIIDDQSSGESVIRASDGSFHLYATGSGKIQHWTSKDSVNWTKQPSQGITGAPSSVTGAMWKPSISKVGDVYVMAWAGSSGSTAKGSFGIYYGTGSSPGGPFKYGGQLIQKGPTNNIDPQIFADDGGGYYLFYTAGRQGGLKGVKLNVNGANLSAAGSPKTLLNFDGAFGDVWTIEAPYVIKRSGKYYLTFSTGDYTVRESYRVHVARGDSPLGPYSRKRAGSDPNDIILDNNAAWVGVGTTTVFTDDAGQDWLIYAARYPSGKTDRVSMLDRLTYDTNGWPVVNGGNNASSTQQPGPALTGIGGN
jgi:hypothetical protein